MGRPSRSPHLRELGAGSPLSRSRLAIALMASIGSLFQTLTMEFMGCLCCGFPTLTALGILYWQVPGFRKAILALCAGGAVVFLFAAGAAVYHEVKNGPVIDAVQDHDPVALTKALDAGGSARADVGGDSPWPVLLLAVDYGDLKVVEVLLKHGADPNEAGPNGTPLEVARGKPKIVKLLKRYGAM